VLHSLGPSQHFAPPHDPGRKRGIAEIDRPPSIAKDDVYEPAVANVSRQTALVAQAEAQLAMARAQLSFAEKDASRYEQLASTGSGTVKMQQQADTSHLQRKSIVHPLR
jgi:multidrug resistance efflux pump